MTSCSDYGDSAFDTAVNGPVWQASVVGQYYATNACDQVGRGFEISPSNPPSFGTQVKWSTVTPPSMQIVGASTPANAVLIDPDSGNGFNASYFWNGGTQTIYPTTNCCGGMYYGTGINRFFAGSRYFGWSVTCQAHPCGGPFAILSVHGVQLVAVDNSAPSITAVGTDSAWSTASSWIRGAGWQASIAASDDSGVCNMGVTVGSTVIQGPVDWLPNTHSWTQCPTPQTQSVSLDTSQYPDGSVPLSAWASDAASPANKWTPSMTLHIDNQPVYLAMAGPTDALSTAGTQYVDATATAGPSGLSGFACSVDGAAAAWYPGSLAHVAVAGLGLHHVSCTAYNNAHDPSGTPGSSAPYTFAMTIRQPTVAGLWFPGVRNPIRCTVTKKRVRVPGKWVTVFRHHRPVWVQRPGHTVTKRVTHCHARVVTRRSVSWTLVKRNGRKRWIKHVRYVRVVLPPTPVNTVAAKASFGRSSNVVGWLGTSGLAPLVGQQVLVLAAPANGALTFHPVAAVSTRADGTWTATLPPGPSRTIQAVYLGSTVTEPAFSNQAGVSVPARLRLSIRPQLAHWGGRIRIAGQLLGGYVPTSGELVVLYIGWRGGHVEIGHLYTDARGRFSSPYTFLRGNGTERYWIWATSAKESDYPYSPASSGRIPITVSQRR